MDSRMKIKKTLVFVSGVLAMSARMALAYPSTNDVDRVFAGDNGTDLYAVFTNAPSLLEGFGHCGKGDEHVLRYFLSKLIAFEITTNMVNASTCLKAKERMIEDTCVRFGDTIEESDIRMILVHLRPLDYCSTNCFETMMQTAREADAKSGYAQQKVGRRGAYSGTPSPNVRRAIAVKRQILCWNETVGWYRATMLDFVRRKLNSIWADMPETLRQQRIAHLVESCGL